MSERPLGSARWTEHSVTADEAGVTVQDILTGPLGISRPMIQRLTRRPGQKYGAAVADAAARVEGATC